MNNKIEEVLKCKSYTMPEMLLKNYKTLGLDSNQALFLMYLINIKDTIVCDYSLFSVDLNMEVKEVLQIVNDLKEKGILTIEIRKNESDKIEEYISLDNYYNKLFMLIIDNDSEESVFIYDIFEKELGRVLSPIEYELINGWLENNYKEEIIIEALKEAVYNGVNNFRYIDKILFEWGKKGIDSIEKVKENKKKFINNMNNNKIEVPDYDWLNDEESF